MKILISLLVILSLTSMHLLLVDEAWAANKKKTTKENKWNKAEKSKKAHHGAKLAKSKQKKKAKPLAKKVSKLKKKEKSAKKLAKKEKRIKRETQKRLVTRSRPRIQRSVEPLPHIAQIKEERNPIVEMALQDIPLPIERRE